MIISATLSGVINDDTEVRLSGSTLPSAKFHQRSSASFEMGSPYMAATSAVNRSLTPRHLSHTVGRHVLSNSYIYSPLGVDPAEQGEVIGPE